MPNKIGLKFASIAIALLFITGCGGARSAKIISKPPGAKVYAEGEFKGVTPVEVAIKWDENLLTFKENLIYPKEIKVEKKGYKSILRKFKGWHKYEGFGDKAKFILEKEDGPAVALSKAKKPKGKKIKESTATIDDQLDSRAPHLEIQFPANNQIIRGDSITISGVAYDDTRITSVTINGINAPLKSSRDLTVVPQKGYGEMKDVVTFKLENFSLKNIGKNEIMVEAMDQHNHITREIINVRREQKAEMQVSNSWAVVVGINDYEDKRISGLKFAGNDAQEFNNFLLNNSGINISPDRILFLKNEEATLDRIRFALGTFLKKALKDDIIYIFFAGHGAPEPSSANDYYLLAYNSNLDSLYSTAIPMEEVNKIIEKRLHAKHIVLLADACHSGEIGSGRFRSITNRSQRFFHWLNIAKEGRAIFTASGAAELSEESEKFGGGHGAFTYYLLKGLNGEADFNKDDIVTIREAYEYTYRNVGEATNGDQHPELKGRFDNNLPLAVLK